ncbi:hypothetical protein [Paludisphaera mucosa]|uniref:DUF502 domain-containing protein n=1 Tax=Paludisphaera mucosa TaxID=3030827 RepID=A0ABT6FAP1_9BACT|nr:hypothetical protein [Paludisphaera mucosa]MDG3004634.1 hypothetical protein [Paludisphaera mucosa]
MRQLGRFLVASLVRGVLFLAPVVLVALLAREGYQMLRRIAQPVARLLPEDRFFGILAEDLVSVAAVLAVFLIAGLFVATRPGRSISDLLERSVLYRVPGYLLVRGAMGGFPGLGGEARPEPALVETDDGWAFALLVERGPPGFCTVFLPDSPTPTSGAVRIVAAERVRPLDASMLSLLACLTRSGTGAGALAESVLAGREPEAREPAEQFR